MSNYTVYIVTDSNRRYLNVDTTSDIHRTVNEIESCSSLLFSNGPHLSRIVFMEKFPTPELAEKRKSELTYYTRMQKEKLIRKSNANWNNIFTSKDNASQKKLAVYFS